MNRVLPFLFCLLFAMSSAADSPDFSSVDSKAKVLALANEGKLEKVHLFPLEVGGQDIEPNIVYLPVGFRDIKRKLDGTILRMAQDGLISDLKVIPEYKGNSFVPARIVIKCRVPGD
jgi:hypothetical protein